MKCLIVEDHLISRKILKELLSPKFDCDIAVNGREAIEAFNLAHQSKQPYVVIFMDIMLPEVDGMEALAAIRSIEKTMEIPHVLQVKAIMTTALDDPRTIIRSLNQCEADAFIVKPITRGKLNNELRKLNLLP